MTVTGFSFGSTQKKLAKPKALRHDSRSQRKKARAAGVGPTTWWSA
jgi:hypothetical protein